MISKRIGQAEFIYNKGAFSLLWHGSQKELVLNIKPSPSEAQELLIQLFVFKKADEEYDD